jgi:2'-5' RNA ligase
VSRLFLAVQPPPEILDAIAALPRSDEPGVRWSGRERWHVTLRFMGAADPDEVLRALDGCSLPRAHASVGPRVRRLGRGAIVAPVDGLDELAGKVQEATSTIGEPVDPRPFTGHITLARLRRRGPCRLIDHDISGSFDVAEIALVNSELHPDGARHTELARFPLGP